MKLSASCTYVDINQNYAEHRWYDSDRIKQLWDVEKLERLQNTSSLYEQDLIENCYFP